LFWAVALGNDIRAHAVTLPAASAQAYPSDTAAPKLASVRSSESHRSLYAPARSSRGRALDLALLSLAFAALLAGNLAFWRHLRRAYASPRRRVWRRG
jgi:hypothetical protein